MQRDHQIQHKLQHWTETALGQSLIRDEAQQLAVLLNKLYGPIGIHLGVHGFRTFMQHSSTVHHVFAIDPASQAGEINPDIVVACSAEAMPFDAKSVSVLLLPHVLEFSPDPHLVLRESARALVPEGHLVLMGFNPYSLWGLRQVLGRLTDAPGSVPWSGQFFSLARVKDWISVLGFEVISGSSTFYLPPIKSETIRSKLQFWQKAGARWWPICAAVYILVARKREIGMTPIVPRWKKKKRLTPGLVEPVTRNG